MDQAQAGLGRTAADVSHPQELKSVPTGLDASSKLVTAPLGSNVLIALVPQ